MTPVCLSITGANGNWQILVLTSSAYSLYGSVGNGVAGGSPTAQRINGAADTALTTAAGGARVAGVQTNPTAASYRSVATISYTSSKDSYGVGIVRPGILRQSFRSQVV